MAVYLGNYGRIELIRKSDGSRFDSAVNASDLNTSLKRFSFDFDPGCFVTGDRIQITAATTLAFIASSGWGNNTQQSQWTGFINVDELGGIRLYDTFLKAVNGGINDAITLVALAPTTKIPIEVAIQNTSSRVLGQVTNYELNTQREAVDSTALSDQFRSQYSSLISGSGQITCFWDYKDTVAGGIYETAHYLLQLALRTEIGSEFAARLYLKPPNYHPDNTQVQINDSLYYAVNGILTATAIQYTTTTIVEMTADFITTGPIRLKVNID